MSDEIAKLRRDGFGLPPTKAESYLTKGAAMSKVLYLNAQVGPKGEKVVGHLVPQPRIKTELPVNFEDYPVRPRGTQGVIVTKHAVKRVERVGKS